MREMVIGLLLVLTCSAAEAPGKRPYSENRVAPVAFSPQGEWTITGVEGTSDLAFIGPRRQKRMIGRSIIVQGNRVSYLKQRGARLWVPFKTPVLGLETYDTRSKEFWLDLRTDPEDLNLPRYVGAANLEAGTMLATGNGRFLFEFQGVWFSIVRTGGHTKSNG